MALIVYKIHSGEKCSFFTLKNKVQNKSLSSAMKGKTIDWEELDFRKVKGRQDCTFSSLGGLIYYGVNNPQALSILKNRCNERLTSINLVENERSYFVLSDLNIVDALDLNKSIYEALDENRILFIDKYIFKPELLDGIHLLRLKRYNGVFCTNLFKKIYDKEKWSGFSFEKVWEKYSTAKS